MTRIAPRNLSRRRLVQTATGAALGGALATTSPSRAAPRRQDVTTVRALMWNVSPTIDTNFERRIQLFNESHQGSVQVSLEFLPYDQYWQQVQLAYASGDPYDIYYWDVQAYGHYSRSLLANPQPLMDAAGLYDPAQYPTDLFNPWRFDGQNLYAIPENFQTMMLYYNKSLFDSAGIAVPDETSTWDGIVEAARALTIRDGDQVTQWGMSTGALGIWWGMQTLSWSQGDAFFDQPVEPTRFQFGNPANVETFRFMQNLIHTEQVAPSPSFALQSVDTTNFQSGRVAIVADGSWTISGFADLPFEWGVAPLPMWGTTRVVPYWMGGWVIAEEGAAPREASFEFARWCATDYQTTMATDHDWIPILTSARESAAMMEGMPTGFPAVTQALATARLADFYSENNQQIWVEVFDPNITQLLNNDKTPEDAARDIDEAANALL